MPPFQSQSCQGLHFMLLGPPWCHGWDNVSEQTVKQRKLKVCQNLSKTLRVCVYAYVYDLWVYRVILLKLNGCELAECQKQRVWRISHSVRFSPCLLYLCLLHSLAAVSDAHSHKESDLSEPLMISNSWWVSKGCSASQIIRNKNKKTWMEGCFIPLCQLPLHRSNHDIHW